MSTTAKKAYITKEEFYCLMGLLSMAHSYDAKIRDIESAIAEILGIEPDEGTTYFGHISDAVYTDNVSAKDLLKSYKVKIK